ncbi:MAG TPA: glycosyltransferase family 2 protein [Saprospiraceae bacterium]|nr:glycosyltransferase family 2 protein [Saprospiraceae bacterium]
MMLKEGLDLSIVIPVYDESESLPELLVWIDRVTTQNAIDHFEVILVDDGSSDDSWKVITNLKKSYPWIKAIRFRRNYGKSAALQKGFEAASGEVVITLDADLQDSPEEIPGLMKMIRDDNFDLVSGWKKNRKDPISKRWPSKFFNAVTRKASGIKLHDFNCGLKAYKNDVVKNIEVYGEMHRYIPVMAQSAGFTKIGEKVVQHQARKFGKTKFGLERMFNGFLDIMSIMFVSKFGKRPMHFFGTLGILFFFIGFCILTYLSVLKYVKDIVRISDRPGFYFGILILIIGSQLFLTGFLAELISRNAPQRNEYRISETIGIDLDE